MDADEVQCAMGGLDPFSQALVHLRFTCELTFEEIGSYLGVGSGVARGHVMRAVEALRQNAAKRCPSVGASDECLDLIAELRAALRELR
jgi:DNA-directed RNA polymerase specialized sigma24 family protein